MREKKTEVYPWDDVHYPFTLDQVDSVVGKSYQSQFLEKETHSEVLECVRNYHIQKVLNDNQIYFIVNVGFLKKS